VKRRDFIKCSALAGGAVAGASVVSVATSAAERSLDPIPPLKDIPSIGDAGLPHLSPARWIWFPSGRTLQNTFLLFRRELECNGKPICARGWIAADSRYRLEVNGERVQWGPPPSDPRWAEADPVDLLPQLKPGKNVIGVTVLFYGAGDGTWPVGKPGFLFWLELEHSDGRRETIVSDEQWKVMLCRAWRPGRYKRWYLRALQEEFDARRFPFGWSEPGYSLDTSWMSAMPLEGSPNKPALSTNYYEYMLDVGAAPPDAELRARTIPMLTERLVPVSKLTEAYKLFWKVSPEDYFDFRVPHAFVPSAAPLPEQFRDNTWDFELDPEAGTALTFEFQEQAVGWPLFTVDAPQGTTIELLAHEAHQAGKGDEAGELALLNTHFDSWTRFICREGTNRFETFDFESLRWLQLHFHPGRGRVRLREVGLRRRLYPWPNAAKIRTGEPALQRLFDACINTLNNSAQETLVDGMARERQQYSGDGGHQLHAVHLAFGAARLVGRYVKTWSQGLTKEGYFLDCWPAYDRLARLVERQLDLSGWGPILDHGVGFNFDCHAHYMYSGSLDEVSEAFPRLITFARYLQDRVGDEGLLPVEKLGVPSVWIDHSAFLRQRHKQCAFNLYVGAAMKHALAPLCQAFGKPEQARAITAFGDVLEQAVIKAFWDESRGLFVVNRPWLNEEKDIRLCDRSLSTAILYNQCPSGSMAAAIKALAEPAPELGFSYPCNAGWRLTALAKAGRCDVVVDDFRQRWATMTSVKENNTLQEDWTARHDSGQQWSHCAVAPLYVAFHGLMGLRPLAPGFSRYELRPQFADIEALELTAYTASGPISVAASRAENRRFLEITTPGCLGELLVAMDEEVNLPRLAAGGLSGLVRYALPPDSTVRLQLKG
jgi:hypothetical protein